MSNSPLKILLVAGARPNFMKISPLIHAINGRNATIVNGDVRFEYALVHTGQHYDTNMSEVFFRELRIPAPDFYLDVGSGSHAVQTANVMLRFESICRQMAPDWVVVVGDVNSTVACALVAVKMGIKVAHVEAGLRSFDRAMPEEINRIITDAISDLLLTPSEDANDNLKREGIPDTRIRLVGNIMIDSLLAQQRPESSDNLLNELKLTRGKFIYVTLHRPSNVDCKETLGKIVQELRRLAEEWEVVFPMHPRTRKRLAEFGFSLQDQSSVRVLEPIGYNDSINLTKHARCVLTDSGGLQEESTFFRTPCLTLRPNTERPVTVTLGSNRLTSPETLQFSLRETLQGAARIGQVPPFWDGRTAERVLEALANT